MHRKGCFLQVIEGESKVVENLFTRLLKDPCHKGVKMIKDSLVNGCLFLNWTMGCADFDEPELSLVPGIRNDLSTPKVIEDLLIRLPEIANFLLKTLD